MHTLSDRLSLIASMVSSGSRVCDVGTDHGYLPAFLYLRGDCRSVIATDIREKPLDNARKNLEKLGAHGVKLLLCDGLSAVTRDMADTVIIAGMGGEVISGIIDRCAFLRDNSVTLLLQPMTSADKLREYLSTGGFTVEKEVAVAENSKIYSVMKVRYSGKPYLADDLFLSIGLLRGGDDASREYIQKQYRISMKKIADTENVESKQSEILSLKRLAEQLEQILEEN